MVNPAPRARARALLVFAVAVAVAPLAGAQGSIVHEFIPADPQEDLSYATTIEGGISTFVETKSGVVTAPDPRRPPTNDEQVYSGGSTDAAVDSKYEPDRDTRRPNVENYDDPFSPATAPFKRLRAYDAVEPDYTLYVRDKNLVPVKIGGAAGGGDEPFYGDITVDLVPNEPVRIPTVGPDSRLLRMHVNPDTPAVIQRDGADNWFVRGTAAKRVRVVVQLAIRRETFGSSFADVEWSQLDPLRQPQPQAHAAAFQEVAKAIGISRAMRPSEAVRKMIEYFRAFAPSDDPPKERGDIYLDLALSKKGVCRHRSFAFLVTALNLGVPARMVVNEAHAWVEVHDGKLWHRVDLGGAALNMDQDVDPTRPPYVPPPDPYAWPESRDSGQDLADRTRAEQQAAQPGPGGTGAGASVDPGAAASAAPPAPTSSAPVDPAGGRTEIVVSAIDRDIRRGLPLHLQGQVVGEAGPCQHVRVDVMLESDALPQGAVVGSLSTDERGRYDGAVVIPRDFALGDYDLVVATPGDAQCKPGRSGDRR